MKKTQNMMPGPRVPWNLRRLLGALFVSLTVSSGHASMSVLLEQPYGKLGLVDPSGHSAVYFDHICSESPIKLRVCRADELGVVVSRYDDVGGYDWVATPLVPYLYSVDRVDDIPESVTRTDEIRLRDAYRREHLESVAPDLPDGKAPGSNWYELVGSAFDRTIYGFRVKTTPEQDAKLIAYFNDSRNRQRYNGMFVNCADFVRTTVDRIYPHAIRRNFVADLGLMSPKSAARGLAHYAAKHPEIEFTTFVVPQVKGSLRRSWAAVTMAEGVVKEFTLPLVLLSPVTTSVAFAAYITQGRFAMPKHAPELDVRALDAAAKRAASPANIVIAEVPAEAGQVGSNGGGPIPPISGSINGPPARPVGVTLVGR